MSPVWYGVLRHGTRPRPSRSTSAIRCVVDEPNDSTVVRTVRPSSSRWRTVSGASGDVVVAFIATSADTAASVPHAAAVADTAGHDDPQAAYAVVSVTPSQARSREISRPNAS